MMKVVCLLAGFASALATSCLLSAAVSLQLGWQGNIAVALIATAVAYMIDEPFPAKEPRQ